MIERPDDRRGYISQPWERPPRRYIKRHRSRDSRERDHRRRPAPSFEQPLIRPVVRNGSDDEEEMLMSNSDPDMYTRKLMERRHFRNRYVLSLTYG
ncbi:unnamed protein product [Strongylus vulgaris]|uniref:Uncharacterized protein n=1 Tax=Strongylus vulgaris TaxID=40348 RepID=A0A3P7I8C5_STRVU|nr:unnamed protein product [Strongylus vulgaris]